MMFKVNKAAYVAAASAMALSIVAATFTSATAVEANGGAQPIYLASANDGIVLAAGSTNAFTDPLIGSPRAQGTTNDATQPNELFLGPTDATGVFTFVSPVGQENNKAAWSAYSTSGFVGTSKNVWLPSLGLYGIGTAGGSAAAVKSAGGDFSLGLAFTKASGSTLIAGYTSFIKIHVTPTTGAWTFETPTGATPSPPPPSGSFDQNLSVTTTQAVDGALNLISPANATTTFGAAVLDPTTKLSTSTATLDNFSVQDDRVVSHPGWTLTSTVANFVSGANTIDKKQLGIAPKVVTANGAGALAGVAQVAGSAVYPAAFAYAENNATVGTTVLGADLKFVAPATAPAGTYTSKLTITLASK